MKYNTNNQPLVCMQTQSTCYKGTAPMAIKGILWHSTCKNNPMLKRYVQPSDDNANRDKLLNLIGINNEKNDWNHNERQSGFNAWVGKLEDGTVATVQTMPWDYRAWGCGVGSKGTCNSGWIQLNICEDDLSDAEYFNIIYAEICEITAYLCKEYNINPLASVTHGKTSVPTVLCHAEAYNLRLGDKHNDIIYWLEKYEKTMDDIRNDVANLLAEPEVVEEVEIDFHAGDVVRIKEGARDYNNKIIPSWIMKQDWIISGVYDERIAIGKSASTTSVINKSIAAKDLILAPIAETPDPALETAVTENEDDSTLGIGSAVQLLPDAKFASGAKIPSHLFNKKLYVRNIDSLGNFILSTTQKGTSSGTINPDMVSPYIAIESNNAIETYIVRIMTATTDVCAGPGSKYKITGSLEKDCLYTIVAEKDGWGKLITSQGWIDLANTAKLK